MKKLILISILGLLFIAFTGCSDPGPIVPPSGAPTPTLNPTATSTPTPDSVATPTSQSNTPTATVTETPTATLAPTPTATPTPTTNPAATPTSTVTPTPTPTPNTYSISGVVREEGTGNPLSNITITFSGGFGTVISGTNGAWSKSGLSGSVEVTVQNHNAYYFNPYKKVVTQAATDVDFTAVKYHFVFHSDRTHTGYQVFLRDGANEVQITNFAYDNCTADLSNDGLSIVFHSTMDGVDFHKIFKMDIGSAIATPLTDSVDCSSPCWSPDKSKIAFSKKVISSDDGNSYDEIFTMKADGTEQTRLTYTADSLKNSSDPTWSPDGSKIAFKSNRSLGDKIYVMNADGTNVQPLATGEYPAWSPDGTKIAYSAYVSGTSEIYIINCNGTGQTRITTNTVSDSYPCWSPDSTRILYQSNQNSNLDIYIMNIDGTNQTRLTTQTGWDVAPGW